MAKGFKTQDQYAAARKKTGKKATTAFRKSLNAAVTEKGVEHAYWDFLKAYYPNDILDARYHTDGVLDTLLFKLLLEVKYDKNLLDRHEQCSVLVQALYYIKTIDANGESKPNLVLIGDEDECFVIHGNHLFPYLEEDVDWNIAPSSAAVSNPKLVLKLVKDNNIKPFIFSIDENFDCNELQAMIEQYATSEQRLGVKITEKNIARIYDDFLRTVIRQENLKKYTENELVSIFILAMTNPNGDTYIVPGKLNTLHLSNGKEIQIDGKSFDAFFCQFDRNYSPKEIDIFNSIADRLIIETQRRFQGSFWTPNIWVDKAHDLLSEVIGETWKDDCIVWDASCGSMNLTRDYKFSNLFCSTLFQEELDIGMTYNPEALKFQYDFLNDDVNYNLLSGETCKAPKSLIDALSNNEKPIVFFNNPPYAQAGEKMGSTGGDKKDVAKTVINQLMINEGYGQPAQQLYAQFLYRFLKIVDKYELKEAYIGLFSPTLFLTGNSYKDFRKKFFSRFEYVKGIYFQASNFADVKDSWGISFTVFKLKTTSEIKTNEFEVDVLDIENNQIISKGKKTLYNLDEDTEASDWVKIGLKGLKPNKDYINLQSALKYERLNGRGSIVPGSLGYFLNDSNNIYANSQFVGMFSAPHAHGSGLNVIDANFENCISLLCARTLISSTWVTQKDEYLKPDTEHPKYQEWLSDCLVYSLFSPKSGQSALRNAKFKGSSYNIKNEWFYMSVDEIQNLANEANDTELYQDTKGAKNRYVYNKLLSATLSPEAQAVLNKAREITAMLITEGFRLQTALEYPEYHLCAWDAGWYQMKMILKKYSLPELAEFEALVTALENKMRPMVYELKFLK